MEDIELFARMERCLDSGAPAALATVAEATGSTPRGEGARMIVLPDGSLFGTVGGGCVEGAVRTAALEALLKTKRPRLIEITLTADPDQEEGDVCGGTMRILVEPFFP